MTPGDWHAERRRLALAISLALVLAVGAAGAVGVAASANDSADGAASHTVEFTQTAMGNVFLANETATVDVESDADRVVWVLERYGGQRVANGTVSVDGETTLELPVEGVGHYQLHAWPAGATGDPSTTTVGVLPADDFDNDDRFYGMSAHFGQGWDHDLMDLHSAAGVASVRDEHGWMYVEESKGNYDFSGPTHAAFMEKLRDGDYERLFILAYGNPIYGGEWNHAPHNDSYREAYANYSRAVVDRYDGLEYVEVWNEYDLAKYASGPAGTDPAAYAELLAATYPAVKAERPNVTVVGGATSGVDFEFWEGVLAAGGAEHVDVMSVHPYRGDPSGYAEDVARLRNLTREHNDGETIPIWVTEFGWSTGIDSHTSASIPGQARNLVQAHVRMRAAGIERAYWYTFRDDQPGGGESASGQWGLVRHPDDPQGAYTPRPSFLAYATMTRQVAGDDPTAVETDAPVEGFVYESAGTDADGPPTSVLWTPPARSPTAVTLHTDDAVTVRTMTGQRHRLVPRDGEVYLSVTSDPLYVEGSIREISQGAPVSIGGTTETLELSVTAGENAERRVTHTIDDQTVAMTAAAGDTATEQIALPTAYRPLRPSGEDVVYVDGQTVRDTVSIDGEPVALLSTRVRPDAISPAAADGTTETPTDTGTTTATPHDSQTTADDEATATAGDGTDETTSTNGPGFDVALALFALVATVLVARRGHR